MRRARLSRSGSRAQPTRLKPVLKDVLRQNLVMLTGCDVQHTGWPCNTCFHSMKLDLNRDIHDYWVAVLALRGDYPRLKQRPELIAELDTALKKKLGQS